MKITNQSFPHPVLGIQDDVSGKFEVALSWSCDRAFYYLHPLFDIQNTTLEDLLRQGKAIFLVHIECSNTFFNNSFTSIEKSPTIKITAEDLRDEVEVSFYFCANSNIPDYKIHGSHRDYESQVFNIETGDILAYGGKTRFMAVKNYESLKAVSSIMEIKKGGYEIGLAKVKYNESKIELILSREDFRIYNENKNDENFNTLFHTSLVLPVLYKALHYIQMDEPDYASLKWFNVLKTRLDDENLSVDDDEKHFEIIQKLFGNPINRFFGKINNLNDALYND